jgi:hypothetical protein
VIWLAVFSHFVLDLLVQGGTLYPGASLIKPFIVDRARLFQLAVCSACLSTMPGAPRYPPGVCGLLVPLS